MDLFCSVINDAGLRFNARIVRKGDRYGLNHCLVHEDEHDLGTMVEIYDARYTGGGFTPLGQFVSRYYVRDLLDAATCRCPRVGLDMLGYVDAWKLDGVAHEMLCRFLRTL